MASVQACVGFGPNGIGDLDHRRFVVNVLGTNEQETSAALEAAAVLARNLEAVIRIVSFQIVPYPLELNEPCVPPAHTVARFTTLVRKLTMETCFQIYYCRDVVAAIEEALAPRSLIVVGKKKRWWMGRDSRQTRLLRARGHDLVVVEVR